MNNEPIASNVEFCDACITKFGIESNREQGGDAGNGSKTIFNVEDQGGTMMKIQFEDTDGKQSIENEVQKIKLIFEGDAEYKNFCKGINFINNQLKGDDE